MNAALTTTSAKDAFRAVAADRMVTAAGLTLHELVDEYARLQAIISAGTSSSDDPEDYGVKYSDAAKMAISEAAIINGAAKARFGIMFNSFDGDHL